MTEIRSAEDYRYYCEHGKFPPEKPKMSKTILKEEDINPIYWDLMLLVKSKKAIFIPGNVPSSKNSKEIQQVFTGKSSCCNAPYIKTGKGTYICTKCDCSTTLGKRPILIHSKTVKKYIEDHEKDYIPAKTIFQSWKLKYPIHLGFYYVRDSLRIFDGVNASQIILDLMVKNNIIEDDNTNYIKHVDLGDHKDPKNAGVILVPLIGFNESINDIINKIDKWNI